MILSLALFAALPLLVVNGSKLRSEFDDPPLYYRPRIRYFMPSGLADPSIVAKDVQDIVSKGFGGAEFLDFQDNGSNDTYADPTLYGHTSQGVLNAAEAFFKAGAGYRLDWAQSSIAGAGVPLYSPDDVGAATELARGVVVVYNGSSYHGAPPPAIAPATGVLSSTLYCVVAAKTVGKATNESTAVDGVASPVLLDFESMTVVPANTTFSAADGDYLLFGFWFRGLGEVLKNGGFSGQIPGNVSSYTTYAGDHYSWRGAQAVIAMNQQFFQGPLGNAWNTTGVYLWEDSIEIDTQQIWWTDDIPSRFGYDIRPYLPFLYANVSASASGATRYSAALSPAFSTPNTNVTTKIRNDYFQALTDGYKEYLETLSGYAESVGLAVSCQPGYNQPVDFLQAAPLVALPETESLTFNNSLTAYRWMAGGAHIGQCQQTSTEIGAVLLEAYQATWPVLLGLFNQGFAAGINQAVLHGFPYTGYYPGYSSFPGFEPFAFSFEDGHGPRQPAWKYYKTVIDQIARAQYVLALGKPVIDLVVYRLSYFDDRQIGLYPDDITPLTAAGYSFDFVSPYSLELNTSVVKNNRLSPADGPGYSALIINNYLNATIPGLKQIHEFAKKGLPVVISGSKPSAGTFFLEDDSKVQSLVGRILALSTSRYVASEDDIASALIDLGIAPAAQQLTPNPLIFSLKRHDPETKTDYFYVYNSGTSSESTTISLENKKGRPVYSLNTWTGAISPVVNVQEANGRSILNITLKALDYRIFAIGKQVGDAIPLTVVNNASAAGYEYDGTVWAKVVTNQTVEFALSNGSVVTHTASVPAPINLTSWNLSVESWAPISNTSTGHTTSSLSVHLDALVPWNNISTLYNVSGTAIYSSSFTVPKGYGAILDMNVCFHTCNVSVNGQPAESVNLLDAVIDITDQLSTHGKSNTIEIEVATPLGNLLRKLALENYDPYLDSYAGIYPNEETGYGIQSPVIVRPYSKVALS